MGAGAPGAVTLPPADKQLIEEFYANPPWDAAAALTEQQEGEYGGGGNMHGVITYSGDGCGDGGYCHGEWVRPTEKGHKHGEKIGGSPWEPVESFCYLFPNPICNIGEKIQKTKH